MKPETKSQLKFTPVFSELCDTLSIKILKRIFIPSHKEEYDQEIKDIIHDLDLLIKDKDLKINGEMIKALMVLMLSNRFVWENESKFRASDKNEDFSQLKITHSINGVRCTARNEISKQLGDRTDKKIDCLAAELKSDLQNWDIFN